MPAAADLRKPNARAFRARVDAAVSDTHLRTALTRALPEFGRRRARAFADQNFEQRRRRVRDIKLDALANLPELVERFQAEAEAVGAVVHYAKDAEHAREIITRIATEHGAKTVVKSKSMATEEITLNPTLEAAGMRVVETDLGEWIMQLAGEHPSHLIAPAVHKTREQIATLFSKEVGEELPADPDTLVAVARDRLRQAFIDADVGISGANVAVADSGTLVIVSNEGNGRLVTTLPPVHIALLGVEKIVPTLEDATAILQVLPRSATGQKITSYVSFVTGPSRSADIELTLTVGVHGPKELHIVLLDNGRWATREDPELRETLHCIRCGACSNVCPPYQIVGGHQFGHIYTGPIGLIMTAMHHGLDNAAGPQSLCMSCNACEVVCPVEIPIPRMILDVRSRVVDQWGLSGIKGAVIERWEDPKSVDRWLGLASNLAGPLTNDAGLITRAPFRGGLTDDRHLPRPARRPFHATFAPAAATTATVPNAMVGARVAYLPGCLTDRVGPHTADATTVLLRALGCDVIVPAEQHCCGLVAFNSGDRPRGIRMAQQTITNLEALQADVIVSTSTSCLAAMLQDYQHVLDDAWRARAADIATRLTDLSTFLVEHAHIASTGFLPGNHGPSVTWHDACQSNNALGLGEHARHLVVEVLGLELREMPDSGVCCGFGGSFAMEYPKVSIAILGKKLVNAASTSADVIVSDNPGCLMQIKGGLSARGATQRAMHIAELLAERLA